MKLPLIVGILALVAVLGTGLWATDFPVYLGNDSTACNNCHVMDYAYEGWYHAAHQSWAGCVDCHVPHNLIPKYLYKAKSGMNHVTMFTLGHIPEPLRAKDDTKQIVQANCVRCHEETVSAIADGSMDPARTGDRFCAECHRSIAHGERGIVILPYQDTGLYRVRDLQPAHPVEEN